MSGHRFYETIHACYVKLVVCYEHFVVCNKESPQQRAKHELQSARMTEQHRSAKFLSAFQHACLHLLHHMARPGSSTWPGMALLIIYNPWLDSYESKILLFITYLCKAGKLIRSNDKVVIFKVVSFNFEHFFSSNNLLIPLLILRRISKGIKRLFEEKKCSKLNETTLKITTLSFDLINFPALHRYVMKRRILLS